VHYPNLFRLLAVLVVLCLLKSKAQVKIPFDTDDTV